MRRRLWIWILAVPAVPGGRVALLASAREPADKAVRAPRRRRHAGRHGPFRLCRAEHFRPPLPPTPQLGQNQQVRLPPQQHHQTIGQLTGDRHAILLENAFIDTSVPLKLSIPAHLRSQGDPGAYIVQARGPIDNAFRALLAAAGAQIVSYIPNDAYLVRVTQGVRQRAGGTIRSCRQ